MVESAAVGTFGDIDWCASIRNGFHEVSSIPGQLGRR